jgi:hypothetical protein
MAFKAKSAAETKAAELASALVRIADREGVPLRVGWSNCARATRA